MAEIAANKPKSSLLSKRDIIENTTTSRTPMINVTSVCEDIPFTTFRELDCSAIIFLLSNNNAPHDRELSVLLEEAACNYHRTDEDTHHNGL